MRGVFLIVALLLVLSEGKTRWFELEAKGYDFEQYKREFPKHYKTPEEEATRRNIFQKKLEEIKAHNRIEGRTWHAGVNQFTDRTDEEFARVRGVRREILYREHKKVHRPSVSDVPLPLNKDWRDENVISTVKDQGQCGSCWSFAATETIESYWALATGDLPMLSEQFMLDATKNPNQCGGTGGCQGATVILGMQTIVDHGGMPQEYRYPYTSYFGQNSHFEAGSERFNAFAKVKEHVHLPSNEQQPILQHLAQVGPLAGVVDASQWSSYEAGVFSGCSANATIDHGIQIVGYGHDSELKKDYWLIRNSWSPSFGEEGYIRIARDSTPVCGWDNEPGQGVGCLGGPSKVQVCGECAVLYGASYAIV